jgi:hypothetical protein
MTIDSDTYKCDMPEAAAQLTVRDYACAGCYGHLRLDYLGHGIARVYCHRCGPDRGFVSKHYVDQRRSDSIGEAIEVRNLLQEIGVLDKPKRSANQILTELGF